MTSKQEEWDLELVPQSFQFEIFKKGSRRISWGVVLWPGSKPFFVDIMDHDDRSISIFGGSDYYETYEDALNCVLGHLEMSHEEYLEFPEREGQTQLAMIQKMMRAISAS